MRSNPASEPDYQSLTLLEYTNSKEHIRNERRVKSKLIDGNRPQRADEWTEGHEIGQPTSEVSSSSSHSGLCGLQVSYTHILPIVDEVSSMRTHHIQLYLSLRSGMTCPYLEMFMNLKLRTNTPGSFAARKILRLQWPPLAWRGWIVKSGLSKSHPMLLYPENASEIFLYQLAGFSSILLATLFISIFFFIIFLFPPNLSSSTRLRLLL